MYVSYSNFQPDQPHPPYDRCAICDETLNQEKKVVAHKPGQFDPIHEKCLKQWLIHHSNCPSCSALVDQNSVFSISDDIKVGATASLILTGKVLSGLAATYFMISPIFDTEENELAFIADFYLRIEAISLALTQYEEISKISECFIRAKGKKGEIVADAATLVGLIGTCSISYIGGLIEVTSNAPFLFPKLEITKVLSSLALIHLSTASIAASFTGWISRLPFSNF